MQWWNDFNNWLYSDNGEFVLGNVVVPAVSIIVAGLLAAWIASAAVRRVLANRDREIKAAAIGALIDAAEQATVWHSLTPQEQVLSDRATGQADIQVRLLPVRGSDVAADWASHALREMKRNSAAYGYQVEPAVIEFRDQLVEWQRHPARMRKLFLGDLERWSAESASTESQLQVRQDQWNADQHHERYATPDFNLKPATLTRPPAAQNPVLSDTATQRVLDNVESVERSGGAEKAEKKAV